MLYSVELPPLMSLYVHLTEILYATEQVKLWSLIPLDR
jgi:hypothetical protein